MALPDSTYKVLKFLGYPEAEVTRRRHLDAENNPLTTYVIIITEWPSTDPQPTEAEILATAASPEFLNWEAENGGNLVRTRRRRYKEAINSDMGRLFMAHILEQIDRGTITGTPKQYRDVLLGRIEAGEVD